MLQAGKEISWHQNLSRQLGPQPFLERPDPLLFPCVARFSNTISRRQQFQVVKVPDIRSGSALQGASTRSAIWHQYAPDANSLRQARVFVYLRTASKNPLNQQYLVGSDCVRPREILSTYTVRKGSANTLRPESQERGFRHSICVSKEDEHSVYWELKGRFGAIAACFFLDTASNSVSYTGWKTGRGGKVAGLEGQRQ